jgi:hypothetical protein
MTDQEHLLQLAESSSTKFSNFLKNELEAIPLRGSYITEYPRMSSKMKGSLMKNNGSKSAIESVIVAHEIMNAFVQEAEAELIMKFYYEALMKESVKKPPVSKYDSENEISDMYSSTGTRFFDAIVEGFRKSSGTWAIIGIDALTTLMAMPEFVREQDVVRDCCFKYCGKFMGKRLYANQYSRSSGDSDIIFGKAGAIEVSNGTISMAGSTLDPITGETISLFEHNFVYRINPEKLDRIEVRFASLGCFI